MIFMDCVPAASESEDIIMESDVGEEKNQETDTDYDSIHDNDSYNDSDTALGLF